MILQNRSLVKHTVENQAVLTTPRFRSKTNSGIDHMISE